MWYVFSWYWHLRLLWHVCDIYTPGLDIVISWSCDTVIMWFCLHDTLLIQGLHDHYIRVADYIHSLLIILVIDTAFSFHYCRAYWIDTLYNYRTFVLSSPIFSCTLADMVLRDLYYFSASTLEIMFKRDDCRTYLGLVITPVSLVSPIWLVLFRYGGRYY